MSMSNLLSYIMHNIYTKYVDDDDDDGDDDDDDDDQLRQHVEMLTKY